MAPGIKRWQREELARRIEVAYITDEQRRTVEWWWEHFKGVEMLPLIEVRRRQVAGRWTARREQYRQAVTQDIIRETKRRVVADRVSELQAIQQVHANVLEMLAPIVRDGRKVYHVEPSSFEGMVGALVKLDAVVESKRDNVIRDIEPELEVQVQRGEASIFSQDEIRGVARMLLESRRKRQLQLTQGTIDVEQKEREAGEAGSEGGDEDDGGSLAGDDPA